MSVNEDANSSKMYACAICTEKFSEMIYLDQHIQVVHLLELGKCSVCSNIFPDKKRLYDYIQTTRDCIFCPKPYPWIPRNNRNKKRHECPYCVKSFVRWKELYVHLHVHKKPFECTICGKDFSTRRLIRRHLILKHHEKPCIFLPSLHSEN